MRAISAMFRVTYNKMEALSPMRDQSLHAALAPVSACGADGERVLFIARSVMTRVIFYFLLLCLSCAPSMWAQPEFVNLDFEEPTLIPYPGKPDAVYFDALLGWSGFLGTNQVDWLLYNSTLMDSTGISIIDTNAPPWVIGSVIQGKYTVVLEAGVGSSPPPWTGVDVSLSQTGEIPLGTRSLSFLAFSYGPFTVSLSGADLNLISIPVANQNYNLYEADVSAYAGQTAELKFTVFAQNPYNNDLHVLILDAVQFSPEPIPEPSAMTLLLVGITGLVSWYRISRKPAGRSGDSAPCTL